MGLSVTLHRSPVQLFHTPCIPQALPRVKRHSYEVIIKNNSGGGARVIGEEKKLSLQLRFKMSWRGNEAGREWDEELLFSIKSQ